MNRNVDTELLREVDILAAKSTHDPTVAAAHRARLAELVEGEEDGQAVEQFRAAAMADPYHIGAARGLTRVAQETDDPAALVDALLREAEAERDAKAASDLYVQSATVRLQRIGDHDGARRDFAQALELWTLIRDRELLDASGRAFVVGWDSVRFDVRIRAGDEAHHVVARDADLPALADLERALSLIRTEISLRGLHEAAADSS